MSTNPDHQDRSTRFVLPAGAPLVANLAALWVVDPKLAAAIEAVEDAPSYPTEPSRSGLPTVAMPTSDARTILLHSRHDPLDEARQLVATLPQEDAAAFYVHGFGLGYHVEQLFESAGQDAIVCVIEPDPVMLRTAFEQRDFSKVLESGRVLFFTREDKAELFARLTPHMALVSLGLAPLVHAPSLRLNPDFHRQYQTWFEEFVAYCRTSMATLVLNGRRTAENISRNLAWYAASPSIARLKDCYAHKPAIIVSAGPSLRKNKHLLRDFDGKAVIIAVQTTLQPLLELGVEPQFVTSLDYHEICTRFFEKLPPSLNTELVAEAKATNAIFEMNPGPISLLGNEFADGLIRELRPQMARLRSGATVAHLAFYLAEHCGCNPIIFVGQDLGFSDGLCYAPGTSYDDVWRPELSRFCTLEMKQWEQVVRDRNILRRTTDYQGNPTYTEERLFTYLQHFERDFCESHALVIDATEGGVRKRGAEPMALADAIEKFCREPIDRRPPAHPGQDWKRLHACMQCLRDRRHEAESIERISHETLPLLEEVRDRIADQALVNLTISRIDLLRAQMHAFAETYKLVMQLSHGTELKKFQADRRISCAKLDGHERQRRQVDRDIENVRSVIAAARAFQELMDQVAVEMGRMIERRDASSKVSLPAIHTREAA
jgi:hypothetical protein